MNPTPNPSVTVLEVAADGLTISKHDDVTGRVDVRVEYLDADDCAGSGTVDVTLTADDAFVDRPAQDDWEAAATVRDMYEAIEAVAVEAAEHARWEVLSEIAEARRVESMLDLFPNLAGHVEVGHWLTVLSPGSSRRILVNESRRDVAALVSLAVLAPAKMPAKLRAV